MVKEPGRGDGDAHDVSIVANRNERCEWLCMLAPWVWGRNDGSVLASCVAQDGGKCCGFRPTVSIYMHGRQEYIRHSFPNDSKSTSHRQERLSLYIPAPFPVI